MSLLEQILTLGLINLGLAAVVGVVLGYTAILEAGNERWNVRYKLLIGILIFGLMSIIGTYSTNSLGALFNFRDGGVISGGLFFGGGIGIGASLLGTAYRATLGGVTMIPCLLGTLSAGIISGYLYHRYRSKITVLTATIAALGIELFHVLLVIILVPGEGVEIVFHSSAGLFVIMSTLSVLVFSSCYTTMLKRQG